MPNYHPYIISSLPYLHFGTKAPMEFNRFLELVRDFIPQKDLAVLENCADIFNPLARIPQATPVDELQSGTSPHGDEQKMTPELCPWGSREPYKAKGIVKVWHDFEFGLRNELVKIRAKRRHKNAAAYLRNYLEVEPSFAHKLSEIVRQPQPLEVERALDTLRWNKLDELCFGHYFDIEFLFIYAQKLLILKRWDIIHSAERQQLLDRVITVVEQHA